VQRALALFPVNRSVRDEAGDTLLHFVGSLAHPDFVCSLALLPALPPEYRQVVLDLMAYALDGKLVEGERLALFDEVTAAMGERFLPSGPL